MKKGIDNGLVGIYLNDIHHEPNQFTFEVNPSVVLQELQEHGQLSPKFQKEFTLLMQHVQGNIGDIASSNKQIEHIMLQTEPRNLVTIKTKNPDEAERIKEKIFEFIQLPCFRVVNEQQATIA